MLEGADVAIGPIANDRMFVVLDRFFNGDITDVALIKSLSALQLGNQVVALTQAACNAVRIVDERSLSEDERTELIATSEANRAEGVALAERIWSRAPPRGTLLRRDTGSRCSPWLTCD